MCIYKQLLLTSYSESEQINHKQQYSSTVGYMLCPKGATVIHMEGHVNTD